MTASNVSKMMVLRSSLIASRPLPSVAPLLRPLLGPSREILRCPGDRHHDKANRQRHQYYDAQDQVCRCLC